MPQSPHPFRVRLSAVALAVSGVFFLLYPALRPFSDEVSLEGAAAFGSSNWLAAHMLAMVAFTLLPLGLYGLYRFLRQTRAERLGFWAFVFAQVGVGLTLPFYGGEAYGLHAIGQAALQQQTDALMSSRDRRSLWSRTDHVPSRPSAPRRWRHPRCASCLAIWRVTKVECHSLCNCNRVLHPPVLRHPTTQSSSRAAAHDWLLVDRARAVACRDTREPRKSANWTLNRFSVYNRTRLLGLSSKRRL